MEYDGIRWNTVEYGWNTVGIRIQPWNTDGIRMEYGYNLGIRMEYGWNTDGIRMEYAGIRWNTLEYAEYFRVKRSLTSIAMPFFS